MSSFSTKGAIPPLPDVLIYLYTRAGCTSIASILTGDTRMLVGLGSECGNVLLMEALKSWPLIGRANFISTNGLSFALGSQPLGTISEHLIMPLQFHTEGGSKSPSGREA